ncbi:DUF1868 domain-containing protein [Granulosicoccus sp.]|nr:DUF1868 domain-containing protein [Granulosicoccus sp.]MDB4223662.1 DUF1868 domain-containing protein [Granulosicoccus sp.]
MGIEFMGNGVKPRPDQAKSIERLTGRYLGTKLPSSISVSGEAGKFSPEGAPLFFPGNTFICHLDPASEEAKALTELQEGILTGPAGDYFAFVPPASFHMTMFQGVCGSPLDESDWPSGVVKGESLSTINDEFKKRLESGIAFSPVNIIPEEFLDGHWLAVVGETELDIEKLWSARRILQDLTGLIRANYNDYRFHITTVYQRKWMSDVVAIRHLNHSEELYRKFLKKVERFRLNQVTFCEFENMHKYSKIVVVPAKRN